jgi:hypothetical protein
LPFRKKWIGRVSFNCCPAVSIIFKPSTSSSTISMGFSSVLFLGKLRNYFLLILWLLPNCWRGWKERLEGKAKLEPYTCEKLLPFGGTIWIDSSGLLQMP